MIREIIKIDENKCTGCGDCVPNCHEGALQIIDGKARLISDLFCDGLGACIGHCPTGALEIEKREAEPYNERKVMEEYIISGGPNVIKAHLQHLKDHKEFDFLAEAVAVLKEKELEIPSLTEEQTHQGCPGSKQMIIEHNENNGNDEGKRPSQLTQWPVQLHLINPESAYYKNSDLLVAADCTAFAYADIHKDFMKGKSVAIACPKLDSNLDVYVNKLANMVRNANLKSITVLIMQVPCCGGLTQIMAKAMNVAGVSVPLKVVVVGINGEILQEAEY